MKKKIWLYLHSLLFFFIIEGIVCFHYDSIEYFKSESLFFTLYFVVQYNRFASLMLLWVALDSLLFILCFCNISRKDNLEDEDFQNAQKTHEFSYLLFIITYIVPILLIYLFGTMGKICSQIWLFVVGIISINTTLYYRNPTLYLLGFRLYRSDDGKGCIISKGKYRDNSSNLSMLIDQSTLLSYHSKMCCGIKKVSGFVSSIFYYVNQFISFLIERCIKLYSKYQSFHAKHPFVISVFLSSMITFLMIEFGLIRWETSDDFSMSQLLMGTCGESTPYAGFISYYLGVIVIMLQKMFPIINWLTGLELISVWVFFAVTQWLLFKYSKKNLMCIEAFFAIAFEPLCLLSLQYTRSSFFYSFSGFLLIFDACLGWLDVKLDGCISIKSNIRINLLKIASGIFLCVFGSLFRFHCIFICMVYIGVLLFGYIISVLKIDKYQQKLIIKNLLMAIIFIVGAFSCAYILHTINGSIYDDWYRTNGFQEYNRARYNVTDYMPSTYSNDFSTEDFVISENDYFMLKQSVINDAVFSIEYLEKVRQNIDLSHVNQTTKEHVYNLRQAVFYRSGRLTGKRTIFLVALIVCLLAIFCVERTSKVIIIADLLVASALVSYFLMRDRLPPWVSDPIYLLTVYIALLQVVSFEKISFPEKSGYPIRNYIFNSIVLLCLLERVIATKDAILIDWKNDNLSSVIEYAENSEDVFLLDNFSMCPYPYIDVYGAMAYFDEGQWDNFIRVGNWDIEHPARNSQKELLGIDSVISSLAEGKAYLITTSDFATYEMYRCFFAEHYDVNIYFESEMDFGEYSIVSVKTL